MSQKIELQDDSVIKLTIKQGTEEERFDYSCIDKQGNVYKEPSHQTKIFNIYQTKDYELAKIQSTAFSSGELVCSRDTNRLFVGNFSDVLKERQQQQTIGGTLAGNKYLGYVDSKPDIVQNVIISPGTPVSLSSTNNSGLLEINSPFRSTEYYETIHSNCVLTSDKKWNRESFYNEKYDAYDGDYAYDIYRNALILFDHNIKPSGDNASQSGSADAPGYGSPQYGKKRKTPLIPWKCESVDDTDIAVSKGYVEKHTRDMYGDGYVLLYNIIPDGETITFMDKNFQGGQRSDEPSKNKNTGQSLGVPTDVDLDEYEPFNNSQNYSYNILRIGKVRYESIEHLFDNSTIGLSLDKKITAKVIPSWSDAQVIDNVSAWNTKGYTNNNSSGCYFSATLKASSTGTLIVTIGGKQIINTTVTAGAIIPISYLLGPGFNIKISGCLVNNPMYIPLR